MAVALVIVPRLGTVIQPSSVPSSDQTCTIRYVGDQGAEDLLPPQNLKVKELVEQRMQGRREPVYDD
jgi:hypothetical protein